MLMLKSIPSICYTFSMSEYKPGQRKLSHPQEMRIVALLARGDKQQDIVDEIANSGVEISLAAVSAVKKRNQVLLDHMKGAIADREAANATRILEKTHVMLNRKMDRSLKDSALFEKYLIKFRNGQIDEEEFKQKTQHIANLSVAELTQLSKEMHAQKSKAEEPGESSPKDSKKQMEELVDAIKKGDKVTLSQIVFND